MGIIEREKDIYLSRNEDYVKLKIERDQLVERLNIVESKLNEMKDKVHIDIITYP